MPGLISNVLSPQRTSYIKREDLEALLKQIFGDGIDFEIQVKFAFVNMVNWMGLIGSQALQRSMEVQGAEDCAQGSFSSSYENALATSLADGFAHEALKDELMWVHCAKDV